MLGLSDVLYGVAYIYAVAMLVAVICVCIYDIKHAPYWREFDRLRMRRLRARPHITILVYVQDDIQNLEACLQSIRQNNTYKEYDIVVADNDSRRSVRSQTRNILYGQHLPVYYYANRHRMSMERVYSEAYRRSRRGELILLLSSHDALVPGMLKSLAVVQSVLPSVDCFELSFSYFRELSLEAVVRELRFAQRGIVRKLRFFGNPTTISLRPGTILRKESLSKRTPKARSVYVPQISLIRKNIFLREPRSIRMIIAGWLGKLVSLAVLGACLVLAVTSDVDQPLVTAWILAFAWTCIVIVQFETIGPKTKLHLFAVAPLSIFIYIAVFLLELAQGSWNLFVSYLQHHDKIGYMREFSYKLQLAFLYY